MSTTKKLSDDITESRVYAEFQECLEDLAEWADRARALEARAEAAEKALAEARALGAEVSDRLIDCAKRGMADEARADAAEAEVARLKSLASHWENLSHKFADDAQNQGIDAANQWAKVGELEADREIRRMEVRRLTAERDALRAKLARIEARVSALPRIFGSLPHTGDPVADILAILDGEGSDDE